LGLARITFAYNSFDNLELIPGALIYPSSLIPLSLMFRKLCSFSSSAERKVLRQQEKKVEREKVLFQGKEKSAEVFSSGLRYLVG